MGKRISAIKKGDDEAGRLVEYFVVVSTRRCKLNATDFTAKSHASLKINADAQTKAKLACRRAHMPGETTTTCNLTRLSSIADCSTVSTSSTCGSEEIDDASRKETKTDSEIIPSSLPLDPSTPKALKYEQQGCLLEPFIAARYPQTDRLEHPLNPRLPQFCHPNGTDIIYASTKYKLPTIHYFALSSDAGKLYGTCLTFYEEFHNDSRCESDKITIYYAPRVLCLLSTYPYLTAFRTYLTQLYRLATTTNLMKAPIERFVLNICEEVPAPQAGEFAVQLSILNENISFWAPPANQPIAYVSLPFKVLFECLDISNIMFVWYSLACEHKVLLVSDQLSLLTVCAEILCSLLFPMKWSHLYIPVLPRSLSAMLDAPMPYLCGISRESFQYVVEEVSDETVVVDLDKNLITLGPDTPQLPSIPHKEKVKLETALTKNAGSVFYAARGISPDQMHHLRKPGNKEIAKNLYRNGQALWSERCADDAYELAPAPVSTSILYEGNDTSHQQSKWDSVQEAFLNFFAATLKDYKKFLPKGSRTRVSWRGLDRSKHSFKSEEFISSQRRDFKPFLETLTLTQAFDAFLTRRMYNASNEPDVLFFDKTIDAQRNKSILQVKKVDTTFLHTANAHRELHQYTAILPNQDEIPISNYAAAETRGQQVYTYPSWPETFDMSMFGTPRPFPKNIAAEFKRTITLSGGRFFVVPRDPFEDYHNE